MHDCVILAIDPGARSGWSISARGKYRDSGVAIRHEQRFDACNQAVRLAAAESLPLVVVAEKWTHGGPYGGPRTMCGLGKSWGLWCAALEMAWIPKSRVLRVYTQTWRHRVFPGQSVATKRAEWDALIRTRAEIDSGKTIESDDEADAICIDIWARDAVPVGKKVKSG